MSKTSTNTAAVPEAKGALDKFKYEVASELGVPLSDGYIADFLNAQNLPGKCSPREIFRCIVFQSLL